MMGLAAAQAAAVEEKEREAMPLRRRGKPDDGARWIPFLADPASGRVTGQIIAADDGLELAQPGGGPYWGFTFEGLPAARKWRTRGGVSPLCLPRTRSCNSRSAAVTRW